MRVEIPPKRSTPKTTTRRARRELRRPRVEET
jgi:hypothetical protein